jgi:hypothetical protein
MRVFVAVALFCSSAACSGTDVPVVSTGEPVTVCFADGSFCDAGETSEAGAIESAGLTADGGARAHESAR